MPWEHNHIESVTNEQIDALIDETKHTPENFINDIKMIHLSKFLPGRGIALEIGAGSGNLLMRIGMTGDYFLIGLDQTEVSRKVFEYNLMKHGLVGKYVKSDARNMLIKSSTVNVLVSGGLLEHFDYMNTRKILIESYRVLKPGGLLYADIVPKKFSLCRPISFPKEYENNFSMNLWEQILLMSGFVEVNVFSGLILPPNFFNMWRKGIGLELVYKCKDRIYKLDNTRFSDIFGLVYFVIARKPKL